jgi:hypothetical protein
MLVVQRKQQSQALRWEKLGSGNASSSFFLIKKEK